MRNFNLTHFDTAASLVETKSYDAAILIISGLCLIGLAASYALTPFTKLILHSGLTLKSTARMTISQ